MTKAWHVDELAALKALVKQHKRDDGVVCWDSVAAGLPRNQGILARTALAVQNKAVRLGLWQAPAKTRRTAPKNWAWISQTCELLMYLDIGEAPGYLRRMKNLVDSFLS